MDTIEALTRKIVWVESTLIGLTIAAIAYGDHLTGPHVSLGYLYLVPLSYSAVTHSLPVTFGLVVACVGLRQWLGPLELSGWVSFIRDWVLTAIFLSLVSALYRLGRDRRQLFEKARQQRDELLREINLAAAVQRRILDRNVPPPGPFAIKAHSWPARETGGDYYDFIELDGNRTALVIADVAGKGLPAALLMPAVQIALRALAAVGSSLQKVVSQLNSVVFDSTDQAAYATLFIGVLEKDSGVIRYVNAGHVAPLVMGAGEDSVRWLDSTGTPVGLLAEAKYEVVETRLQPGELLLLYTDGLLEASNGEQEEFGRERLVALVRKIHHQPAETLIESIRRAVEDFQDSVQDDLTLIAARRADGPVQKSN